MRAKFDFSTSFALITHGSRADSSPPFLATIKLGQYRLKTENIDKLCMPQMLATFHFESPLCTLWLCALCSLPDSMGMEVLAEFFLVEI